MRPLRHSIARVACLCKARGRRTRIRQTLNQLSTHHPQHLFLNPQPSTLNIQHSNLNTQLSTRHPKDLVLNTQHSTLNPQPSNLNPRPSNLNPQPSTLNPQPSTRNSNRQAQSAQPRWRWSGTPGSRSPQGTPHVLLLPHSPSSLVLHQAQS